MLSNLNNRHRQHTFSVTTHTHKQYFLLRCWLLAPTFFSFHLILVYNEQFCISFKSLVRDIHGKLQIENRFWCKIATNINRLLIFRDSSIQLIYAKLILYLDHKSIPSSVAIIPKIFAFYVVFYIRKLSW